MGSYISVFQARNSFFFCRIEKIRVSIAWKIELQKMYIQWKWKAVSEILFLMFDWIYHVKSKVWLSHATQCSIPNWLAGSSGSEAKAWMPCNAMYNEFGKNISPLCYPHRDFFLLNASLPPLRWIVALLPWDCMLSSIVNHSAFVVFVFNFFSFCSEASSPEHKTRCAKHLNYCHQTTMNDLWMQRFL